MEQTDSCRRGEGRGEWRKEGEGISQGTYANNSWTWTTETGLTVEERSGWGEGGQKGTNWDNSNTINSRNK